MTMTPKALLLMILAGSLAACGNNPAMDRQLGYEVDEGGFGGVTRTNTQIMSGEINATQMLQTRFEQEVASTVTFEFNSARLTPEAMRVLSQQADWIRQFPELRFSVFGHTDLVGSNGYNYALGKRRAQAVVNYFASQGISRSRLEALVSYGKTRPVVATNAPEQANRRTVTTVSGFVRRSSAPLNGKYAEVVFREYVQGATRPHPQTSTTASQVNPADN
jgi:outer membrane protein OmpA-like peptidoglycan-associated protein